MMVQMKKLSVLAGSMFLLMLLTFNTSWAQSSEFTSDHIKKRSIRVKINPTISENVNVKKSANGHTVTTGVSSIDKLHGKYKALRMTRVFPYSSAFEEKHRKYGLHLWYEVEVETDADPRTIAKEYRQLKDISTAEVIHEKKLKDYHVGPRVIESEKPFQISEPFNDPYLPKQWHYNNTGQTGGIAGSDIRLYEAWTKTTGNPNVIVSVHDEGIDIKHEDLNPAIFVNPVELNGQPNVDDDGNGYKDDINGFNFADNVASSVAATHATHVAGTIAAITNNGIGVAGIAGGNGTNSGVRILPCQILGGRGTGNTADSYVYAADMGAVISQNSWGYLAVGAYEQVVLDAIDYFIAEAGNYPGSPMKGGVVIFAAGNSNIDGLHYPAAYKSCISVSALDASSNKASYSNYGTWINIAAPGGDSADDLLLDPNNSYFSNGVLSTFENNSYGYLDGTSMACPHVSGVAALITSKFSSSTFTNSDLKAHLLTGVDRSIYDRAENQPYLGKLGYGAIDAGLAVATNNKIPPNAINDFSLVAIAQDFAKVKWNVPVDTDDGLPTAFEIAYSLEPINSNTIGLAKTITVQNFKQVGEEVTHEIVELLSLTKYYIVVRSIDRWGNLSAFSNMLEATTNAGPIVSLNLDTVKVIIDTAVEPIGTQEIEISNSGEGLLKWNAAVRHSNSTPLSVKVPLNYPKQYSTHLQQPKGLRSFVEKSSYSTQTYNVEPPNDEEYHYIQNYLNYWVLGETDTSFTNSTATRFFVTNKAGFNLTHVDAIINHEELTGPVILEVYSGSTIADAKLLLAQEVKETAAFTQSPQWTHIALNDQIFFNTGEYFWIVYHVPQRNYFPLGASLEKEKDNSNNCYYSSNLGKSWSMLEEIYYDNQIVWSVVAMSSFKKLDQYLMLTPDNGQVESQSKSTILTRVDATNMVNGHYTGSIILNTNETNKSLLRLPVDLVVKGQLPKISSINRLDFGAILYGNTKTLDVELTNEGRGKFASPRLELITSNQFKLISTLKTIDAGSHQVITFQFHPTQPGLAFGVATFKDSQGNSFKIDLVGYATEPPIARLNRPDTTFSNVVIADTLAGSFFLVNDGDYPLDYFLPKFSDGSNMVGIPDNIHKFGYIMKVDSSGNSPNYQWTDISTTGTNITSLMGGDWQHNIYVAVDIGFEFPFYGRKEKVAHISKLGTVSFDENDAIWSRTPMLYKYPYSPDRFISAWGLTMPFVEAKMGNVYHQRFADRFVVQYEKVPVEEGFTWNATFQVILFDNGDIRIQYKDVDVPILPRPWGDLDMKKNTFIAMEAQDLGDGILLHQQDNPVFTFKAKSTVDFINPGNDLYLSATNPFGTITSGDSVRINYKIKTSPLNVDNYAENLVIITNDPFHNPSIFSSKIQVTQGGSPDIKISSASLDFGKVFQYDISQIQLTIENLGKAYDVIQVPTFDNGFFTQQISTPTILKPGRSIYDLVSISTANLGVITDTLRLQTTSGLQFKVYLHGEVISGPKIELSLPSVNTLLVAGTSKVIPFTVTNSGDYDLTLGIVGNDWATFTEDISSQTAPGFTYDWSTSKQTGGPAYEWIEIAEGDGIKLEGLDGYGSPQFSHGIKLPFTFTYYGNKYDTLYIGYSGLVTFTKNQERNGFYGFGGPMIPNDDIPNNFIAPLWLGGGADWVKISPLAGQYYRIDPDKIIIEYRDYINGFGMGQPLSFEVILYNNGYIKFQYKIDYPDENFTTSIGSIGLENIDGKEGIKVSYNEKYVDSDMSILFVPLSKIIIPSNASAQYQLKLDATNLVAGRYTHNAEVVNNAPLSKGLEMPITLNVSGTPIVELPAQVDFGDIMSLNQTEQKEFEIKNTGTKDYFLNSLAQNLPSQVHIDYKENGTWYPISTMRYPHKVAAKKSIPVRVTIYPVGRATMKDTLKIGTISLGSFRIPIHAETYLPGVLTLDNTLIEVYAPQSSYTESRTITLGNAGGYPLHYDLTIEFDRTEQTGSLSMLNSVPDKFPIVTGSQLSLAPAVKTLAASETYNRIMANDPAEIPNTTLGYGGAAEFHTVTGFKAPVDGFNLTHVQTWYTPGEWLNGKIRINVFSGDVNIYNAKLIYNQTYTYTIASADPVGSLLTIQLDKNLPLFPGEPFFIEFIYDAGAQHPQGAVKGLEPLTNRFLYGSGNGWSDIVGTGYDDYGWMVRAVEKSFLNTAWVTLSSEPEGDINIGSSTNLKLDFNAMPANPGSNKAKLIIHSNDPKKPNSFIQIVLNRNQGPVFKVESSSLSMDENELFEFDVIGDDTDGFTLSLENYPSFVTSIFSMDTLHIKCTPDFTNSGKYIINVVGLDDKGNLSELPISIEVKNVNRAPQPNIDSLKLELEVMTFVSFNELFTDPDNDLNTVDVQPLNSTTVEIYKGSDGFMIKPKQLGATPLLFTAIDHAGEITSSTIVSWVEESLITGITNGTLENVEVYPNPTINRVYIRGFQKVTGLEQITMYTVQGVYIDIHNLITWTDNGLAVCDLSTFPAGVYIIKIQTNNQIKTVKVIKGTR